MKLQIIMVALVLYVLTALTAYRLRHPQETETQLFVHIPKAMLFPK